MKFSQVVNIEDLRCLARDRAPKSVFDYLDGGAEAELTLAENCRAFRDVTFRPRTGVAFGECDLKRSEEHTSELQSRGHLVCRLLLEKKITYERHWPRGV